MLFAFSSTPRTYFHELIADHQDLPSCELEHDTSVLHQRVKDCQCDKLVVNHPFVSFSITISADRAGYESFSNAQIPSTYISLSLQLPESRGPPAGCA